MASTTPPLHANGAFSLTSGALLTALPALVGDWLDVDADLLLRSFGLLLLGHGALLFWAARRKDSRRFAIANLIAIAPYPLAMVALAASGIIATSLGRTLVLIDGAIIAAIAIWHAAALRQDPTNSTLSPA